MKLAPLPVFALIALLGLAGLNAKDALAQTQNTVGGATPAKAQLEVKGEPTTREISLYLLDMNKMRRWINVYKEVAVAAGKSKSESDKSLLSDSANLSFAEEVAEVNRDPLFRAPLGRNGLTAREFVMTQMAYVQATFAAALMKEFPAMKVPEEQNANMKFVNANHKELEKLMKDAGFQQQ